MEVSKKQKFYRFANEMKSLAADKARENANSSVKTRAAITVSQQRED